MLRIGAGAPPPASLTTVPDVDSEENFLGSGKSYEILDDIGEKLSIATLAKTLKPVDYFGVGPDGKLKMDVNTHDLVKWFEHVNRIVRPYLTSLYPGGTFVDFLMDPDYEPEISP